MITAYRERYNQEFSEDKYEGYLKELQGLYPGQLDFRVAESPVFVPPDFEEKIIAACDHIISTVSQPSYLKASERAIPPHLKVPGEDSFSHFIAFDFGVCRNEKGELEPQLIEMQGFPSLFCWQVLLPEVHSRHFSSVAGLTPYLNGYEKKTYLSLLKSLIIGEENPEQVILLEVLPHQQKTRVDFYATETMLGIKTVCLTELIRDGRQLYYMREGKKTPVKRIFNRVIFDDLYQQPQEIQDKGKIFQEELDVVWLPHPNWFYRLSKFTLPFIDHPFVPATKFLNETDLPSDLENYVVKPLFSFAGQGVIIDPTREEVEQIRDPENWILQRKVNYAPAINTPDEPAKAEIRIFYFRDPVTNRMVAANNLARLSKGKMIGVRYNKDKNWVGGTFCMFENKSSA